MKGGKMDPKLAEAANKGDVEVLREFVSAYGSELEGVASNANYSNSSFLRQHFIRDERKAGNILHLAAYNGREEFFEEAMRILPHPLVHLLLTQPNDEYEDNPLHVAAEEGHLGIMRLIMSFYARSKSGSVEFKDKPWLAKSYGWTPFNFAISRRNEECGLEILMSVDADDMKLLCSMGVSPLCMAVKLGLNRLALQILTSAPSYSVRGDCGRTPLHYVCNSSEEVLKLMLERHPDLITAVDEERKLSLHHWTKEGKLWPLEYVLKSEDMLIAPELKSHLVRAMYATDHDGDTPFHIAVKEFKTEAARILANIYREERRKELASTEVAAQHHQRLPWLQPNSSGVTPFELSLCNQADKEFNSLKHDIVDMKQFAESDCKFLFLAIEKGLLRAAEAIWFTLHSYGWWSKYPPHGQDMWEAALNCSEEVALWVGEKLPLNSEPSMIIRTLHFASAAGFPRLIKQTLEKHPTALKLASLAWVDACQKGQFATIMAFIDNCPYFREICIEKEDTPLHHIKFDGYKQYQIFLKDPIVAGLKNFQDCDGETPLHKSIKDGNLLLTEALLTMDGVTRSIKNNKEETAMELLVEKCSKTPGWAKMCKRNGIIPGLRTTYFEDKTNLLEIRNTLSVVAALLATITFTAGFTLPGGVKSDSSGKATLGNKAAFLVFLLADVLAMCCSMLVLVCLIWSMLCDHNRALLLIDGSMPVLLLALYSTMVAFMCGVYVVIPSHSVWASIVILTVCSIFIVLSKRAIMYKILDKLNPDIDSKDEEQMRLMEEGEARTKF